ncbi:MAG: DVU0298 family protein [Thermodesulfobacteriota bacterium]
MAAETLSTRQLKSRLYDHLKAKDFEPELREIRQYPLKQVVSPLFSYFYNADERVRWHAVTAMGAVVSDLAEGGNLEYARVVMRRMMWNLNDESGGIGWGSPEAMGEAMARNDTLAGEFGNIIVSYLMEEGNYLEHPMLQQGLLWGIGRLARARPERIPRAAPHLVPFLTSEDPVHRGLAAWAAGPLKDESINPLLKDLCNDNTDIKVYMDGELVDRTVASLAREAVNE